MLTCEGLLKLSSSKATGEAVAEDEQYAQKLVKPAMPNRARLQKGPHTLYQTHSSGLD
jgi:hypothetical protein